MQQHITDKLFTQLFQAGELLSKGSNSEKIKKWHPEKTQGVGPLPRKISAIMHDCIPCPSKGVLGASQGRCTPHDTGAGITSVLMKDKNSSKGEICFLLSVNYNRAAINATVTCLNDVIIPVDCGDQMDFMKNKFPAYNKGTFHVPSYHSSHRAFQNQPEPRQREEWPDYYQTNCP